MRSQLETYNVLCGHCLEGIASGYWTLSVKHRAAYQPLGFESLALWGLPGEIFLTKAGAALCWKQRSVNHLQRPCESGAFCFVLAQLKIGVRRVCPRFSPPRVRSG
jgi:hypothetical protein